MKKPTNKSSKKPRMHIVSEGRSPKLLKIAELGHEVLRKKASVVTLSELYSSDFQDFIDDMIATLKDSSGVGLAAPQVYESKRVMIIHSFPSPRYPDAPSIGPEALINPKLTVVSPVKVKGWEGCLSFPGIRGLVPRYKSIKVEYLDRHGSVQTKSFKDFIARIFQHEYDHLNGIVFLDRIKGKDIVTEKEFLKIVAQSQSNSSSHRKRPKAKNKKERENS